MEKEEEEGRERCPWLPDGHIQTFRPYVFGPWGFWTMALLHHAAKFDPFFPWIAPGWVEGEGTKICHLATLEKEGNIA